jgi:DNA polymerase-3 subunit epsilon
MTETEEFRLQFGESVLAERCRRGWSVEFVAEKGGMSHVTWRRIEKGQGFQSGQHRKIDAVFGFAAGTSLECWQQRRGLSAASFETMGTACCVSDEDKHQRTKAERQIIVVDTETTGLDPAVHAVVEVAWWNLSTDERGEFVPIHSPNEVLASADIEALLVNRYVDRLALAQQDDEGVEHRRLFEQLQGNTLAGSNPAFDDAFLRTMKPRYAPGWHYRLLDLSAYAAGVMHLSPAELPGLHAVCELLDVVNPAPHTALGDVIATGTCFNALRAFNALRKAGVYGPAVKS